jgi:AraC-like DNA-binding protein
MSVGQKINAILFETMGGSFANLSPRGCREMENAVLDTLLSSVLDRSLVEGMPVRQKFARKAKEYLRTCCRDPISISDLCAAVGTTRRTLHFGFVELYGVPPMHFLRAIRLRGAREDFIHARRRDVRVADVAIKWGFEHFGEIRPRLPRFLWCTPSAGAGLRLRRETPIGRIRRVGSRGVRYGCKGICPRVTTSAMLPSAEPTINRIPPF